MRAPPLILKLVLCIKPHCSHRYVGEWHNGVRQGKGVHTFAGGSVYDGEWVGGQRHGKGSMQYASGSTYNGSWESDLKHGMGLYRHADQSVYSGRWVRGLMDGTGEYKWPEGASFTTFVGQFRCGGAAAVLGACVRACVLSCSTTNATRRNSKKEGPGVMSFPDGRNWRGERARACAVPLDCLIMLSIILTFLLLSLSHAWCHARLPQAFGRWTSPWA